MPNPHDQGAYEDAARERITLPQHRVIYTLPDQDYRTTPGVSASALKAFRRSPAHYIASLEPREKTPALSFGIYFHERLLTPAAPSRVAVRPAGIDGRTKEGKAWLAAHEGEDTITHDQSVDANKMVEAARAHPVAGLAFAAGHAEVSCFTERGGQALKARMDFVNVGDSIVDAKTVQDARRHAFQKQAEEYGWFLQAAFYCDFIWNPIMDALGTPSEKKSNFVLVAVEKEPPFAVSVYRVSEETRRQYWPAIETMLESFARCQKANHWPAYPEAIEELTPPKWANREEV